MSNLTDKWKKGELPEGWYYVKGNRAEGIYAYTAEYLNNMYRPRNGEKIIEQVPSYDLWKAIHEQWKVLLEENTKLKTENKWYSEQLNEAVKQNDKLKDLLKEIRGKLHYINTPVNQHNIFSNDFIKRLDQVLGE